MRDFYVFDIPVYRVSKERYHSEREKAVETITFAVCEGQGIARSRVPETVRNIEFYSRCPWQFNDVVGWVRLFIEGCSVGGHLWWVEGKRLQVRMKKRFYLTATSNSLHTHFPPPADSKAIFQGTLEALESLSKRKPLKGRFMDLSIFRRVGPFIDWRKLIDSTTN